MSATEFLGFRFHQKSMAEVEQWLRARDADSPYAYVATPNVDHVVRLAEEDEVVHRAYARADLCLCDSRVLARLASAVGVSLTVVPGSDLTERLFSAVLREGDQICLIGGREGDAERLEARFPGIAVMQHIPPMGLRNDAAARSRAVDVATAAGARFTLFAVGSPQQELLAYEMANRADARGTALCIGASVDYLVGAQIRAPMPIRRIGFEWAWRLLSDPKRLAHRYLVKGPAVFAMTWRWRLDRRKNRD